MWGAILRSRVATRLIDNEVGRDQDATGVERASRAAVQAECAGSALSAQAIQPPVSTNTLIRCRLGVAAADAWWQQIDGSTRLRWERIESDRFERARSLLFQNRDKDLSFTDCTSIAVMRELKLETVIATDGHFRQVGFDVLPATRPRRARKPRARA